MHSTRGPQSPYILAATGTLPSLIQASLSLPTPKPLSPIPLSTPATHRLTWATPAGNLGSPVNVKNRQPQLCCLQPSLHRLYPCLSFSPPSLTISQNALSFTLPVKMELLGTLRGKVERETHTYTHKQTRGERLNEILLRRHKPQYIVSSQGI